MIVDGIPRLIKGFTHWSQLKKWDPSVEELTTLAASIAHQAQDNKSYATSGSLGDFFGSSSDNLLTKGAGLLSGLFGNKLDSITGLISNFSGIKNSSSTTLMSMAVPAILGLLGKHASSNNMMMR